MKKTKLLNVLILILLSTLIFAVDKARNPIEVLYTVQFFSFGGTGISGNISEGEIAFKAVLNGNNPKEKFIDIFKNANPQGKCYALVALHSLDLELYKILSLKYPQEKTFVSITSGCIVRGREMSRIIYDISANEYSFYVTGKEINKL